MVTFTTMTRFVDEERTNAGVFKALGYHSRDIIHQGFIFTVWWQESSRRDSAGTLFLVGCDFFYYQRNGATYFYISYSLLALGLSLLSAFSLPIWWQDGADRRNSSLALPKPPVKGSRSLERLPLIWRRLSFTQGLAPISFAISSGCL